MIVPTRMKILLTGTRVTRTKAMGNQSQPDLLKETTIEMTHKRMSADEANTVGFQKERTMSIWA